MKKLLLTLIVSIVFCGTTFAQEWPESNWPDFNYHMFTDQKGWAVGIKIDGQIVMPDYEGWQLLEIAFFVGDECRGAGVARDTYDPYQNYLYNSIEEYGDPYPTTDGTCVYYNTPEEQLSIKVYDHLRNHLYENQDVHLEYMGEPITCYTGEEHYEGWDDPENPIWICLTSPATEAITLDIAPNMWQLIASPVGTVPSENINNLRKNSYDFYYFNQAQQLEWINDKPEGFNPEAPEYAISEMVAGKGYLYAHSDAETRTLTFPGTANTDPVTVTLNKTDSVAGLEFPAWNLVGNPYNVQAYIDRPFYRMQEGAFLPNAFTGAINRMEGVFVVANNDGEEMNFGTEAKAKVGNLALNLRKGNKTIDRAIVSFGDSQMLPKVQFMGETTKVYIPFEGKDYAVVNAGNMGEMPVNFKANENGSYTLLFTNEEVTFSYLHLIDNMTGNDVDLLANPSYTFSAVSNDYTSRFRLVFATGSSVDNDAFGFFNGAGNFCIYGIDGTATVQVMDVTGRILSSDTFSGSYEHRINAAAGVYLIRLINGNDVKVQKVVVK